MCGCCIAWRSPQETQFFYCWESQDQTHFPPWPTWRRVPSGLFVRDVGGEEGGTLHKHFAAPLWPLEKKQELLVRVLWVGMSRGTWLSALLPQVSQTCLFNAIFCSLCPKTVTSLGHFPYLLKTSPAPPQPCADPTCLRAQTHGLVCRLWTPPPPFWPQLQVPQGPTSVLFPGLTFPGSVTYWR